MRERRAVVRQLRDYATATTVSAGASGVLRDASATEAKWLNAIATRLPRVPGLTRILEQGGLSWTPQSFAVVTVGASLGAGLVMLVIFPVLPAVLIAAAVAGAIPFFY